LVGWSLVGWSSVGWSGVGRFFVFRSLVGRGSVGRRRFVLGLNVLRVLGFAFVFHVSGVSVGVSLVGDDLDAAVGENHTVRSGDNVVVRFFGMLEVSVRFFILDLVSEAVGLSGLKMWQFNDKVNYFHYLHNFNHV
jgi:hypothetical protein